VHPLELVARPIPPDRGCLWIVQEEKEAAREPVVALEVLGNKVEHKGADPGKGTCECLVRVLAHVCLRLRFAAAQEGNKGGSQRAHMRSKARFPLGIFLDLQRETQPSVTDAHVDGHREIDEAVHQVHEPFGRHLRLLALELLGDRGHGNVNHLQS